MKYKQSQKLKRIVSGLLSLTMITSMSAVIPANAEEESKQGVYPYAVFAADEQGGITLDLDYLTVNGNGITNGVYSTTAMYPNINGTISENEIVVDEIVSDDENTTDSQDADKPFDVSRDMIYIHNKLMDSWFNNAQNFSEDYSLSEMNINLNSPVYVTGRLNFEGNVSLNSAIGAVSNVTLSGGNLNGNNAVIYSKFGDIKIADSQASMNGLIYAPFGTVTIDCDNFNLNGLIIAQNVVVNSTGANINYSNTWAEFVGTETEELSWTFDDWKYLADTDEDDLPNIVEKEIGTKPYEADTDGDLLPDGYEVLSLGTDPSKIDTDDNGVSDYDEDFDADGLSNGQEYEIGTRPLNDDSDRDSLKDGDEVNTYFTNPLEVDTDMDGLNDDDELYFGTDPNDSDSDDNGVRDGDEKRSQTFIHKVENEDCAITEVIVSMEGTGNLQKTTEVESVMNKDIICTDVVGLVGEPFSIETTSKFDKATLSFKIDQSKLGDTELDNLLFLWYDEDNYKFVELNTIYDEANSLVSIETTHFSRYMVVDKDKWFEAWNEELNYKSISYEVSAVYSVLAVDCSGSMSTYDPITIIPPTGSGSYKPVYSCERQKAVSGFTSALDLDDKAAIVTFESSASTVCELTDNTDKLYWGSAAFYNGGGTSFDAALRQSIDILQASSGGTRKRIILLSDGYSSVSDDIIKELKKDFIKVYTVGIGNCSDSVLREIATETGGEYIKAYKASDLVDIYADIGIGGDFDTTDTDGDGLYDAVESAGIRIQNGTIIHGCDPTDDDTDNDGLKDGAEIDPTIRSMDKHTYPSAVPDSARQKEYYFVMKSNPLNSPDTDKDGYDDIYDIDPTYYDDYSFLDDEIYRVGMYHDDEYYSVPIEAISESSVKTSDTFENECESEQLFRFSWCNNGYKIYSLKYESNNKVLSINQFGNIVLEEDNNLPSQIWEVLPYGTNEYGDYIDGLRFRSKMCYTSDTQTTSYFLSYNGSKLTTSYTDSQNKVKIYSPSKWTRFGELYLNYLGWENTQVSPYNYYNYPYNVSIGLDTSNIENYKGNSMIIYQSGGNFPELMFSNVTMDGVCCEVMGTYNALTLANVRVDYFKLAIEFEMNAIKYIAGLTKSGTWGSDPYLIDNCLDAYNVNYTTIDKDNYSTYKDACDSLDTELKTGKSAIISCHFPTLKIIYAGIHTYASVYDSGDPANAILTFNRFSNHESSKRYSSTYSALNNWNSHYMIGYVLK